MCYCLDLTKYCLYTDGYIIAVKKIDCYFMIDRLLFYNNESVFIDYIFIGSE